MSFQRAEIADFWAKVRPITHKPGFSQCWDYRGSDAYKGFRAFRSVLAHRAAAVIYCGKIPVTVRQVCGNKDCVRLDHLTMNFEPRKRENKAFKLPWNERRTAITKQPVRRKIVVFKEERPDIVQSILDARGTGRYYTTEIAAKVGTSPKIVQKILRESTLYDLMAERKKIIDSGGKVQMEPNKEVKV